MAIQWANGAILFDREGGGIAFDPACCHKCCTGCTGRTPTKWRVTFAGVVLAGCMDCAAAAFGVLGTNVYGTPLDGTWDLDQVTADNNCTWSFVGAGPTVDRYDTRGCGGYLMDSNSELIIRYTLNEIQAFNPAHGGHGATEFFSGFTDIPQPYPIDCSSAAEYHADNELTGYRCTNSGGLTFVGGDGGTAVIVPVW
jgi:hypothetical protein